MIADSVLNVCFTALGLRAANWTRVKVSSGLILVNFWEF